MSSNLRITATDLQYLQGGGGWKESPHILLSHFITHSYAAQTVSLTEDETRLQPLSGQSDNIYCLTNSKILRKMNAFAEGKDSYIATIKNNILCINLEATEFPKQRST